MPPSTLKTILLLSLLHLSLVGILLWRHVELVRRVDRVEKRMGPVKAAVTTKGRR